MTTNKIKITDKQTGAYAFSSEAAGRFYARGFLPKATRNHSFFYGYRTAKERDAKIAAFFEGVRAHKASVAKYREERVAPMKLEVGTVLTGSWGYDQTNVEAWQVVEIVGKVTVKIRRVTLTSAGGEGFMCQNVIPCPDSFTKDEPITKRVSHGNKISFQHFTLSPWNGKPEYSSWYA